MRYRTILLGIYALICLWPPPARAQQKSAAPRQAESQEEFLADALAQTPEERRKLSFDRACLHAFTTGTNVGQLPPAVKEQALAPLRASCACLYEQLQEQNRPDSQVDGFIKGLELTGNWNGRAVPGVKLTALYYEMLYPLTSGVVWKACKVPIPNGRPRNTAGQ